ncbi:MAG TPA: aminotransferase class IV [Bellilinea sp.]|nr:aminotransferase class IV [Bellilinea sp.]
MMTTILSFSYPLDDSSTELLVETISPQITTLDQASNALPAGPYTTFRTYQKTSALHLDDHFQRIEDSAKLAGQPVSLDARTLRRHIRTALERFPAPEARIRLTVPLDSSPKRMYIFVSALSVPTQSQRDRGVAVITADFQREMPSAKLSNFIQNSQTLRERLKEGYEEILMVDDQKNILEGLTSNFYAVEHGVIQTAGTDVLPGITRQIVLQIAVEEGFAVELVAPRLDEIVEFTETFITSSSRGILPVTEINHQAVGSGQPGPVTRRFMELYELRVAAHIEPI